MSSPTHIYDELARTVDRLNRIVEATQALNSTLDLSELTQIILQIVRDEVGIERGTVFAMTPDRQHVRSATTAVQDRTEFAQPPSKIEQISPWNHVFSGGGLLLGIIGCPKH